MRIRECTFMANSARTVRSRRPTAPWTPAVELSQRTT